MAEMNLEIHIPPENIFSIGEIPITNTMITMWIVMVLLIGLALLIRYRMKYLPTGFQNFVEWALGGLYDYSAELGGESAKKHFSFYITFFLFILFSNWLGLTLGVIAEESGFLRAPTSDLNSTLAYAIIAFCYFEYQGVKAHGFFGYLGHFFNIKAIIQKGFLGLIDFFAGILHIVSELIRPAALSLRLFGNIFGGEILLAVSFLLFKAFVPIPFMILEVIVGVIQAFVFSTLFLVFTVLNTAHTEEHS